MQGLRLWSQWQSCPSAAAEGRANAADLFNDRNLQLQPRDLRPGLYDYPCRGGSTKTNERDTLAFAAFFDYTAQRYGTGRLPLLLAELRQPVTWENLIPAVYDVSAEAFEAGWRAWTGEAYGVNTAGF